VSVVELSDRVVVDGTDITDQVSAWRLDRVGRDVPTIVLELNPGVTEDADHVWWIGYANVRVATTGPDIGEFLSALDAEEVERMMLETSDMNESVGAAALRVLRDLASKLSP